MESYVMIPKYASMGANIEETAGDLRLSPWDPTQEGSRGGHMVTQADTESLLRQIGLEPPQS